MDLASVIRAARRRAGLTQASLADKLGVATAAVGQWETNKTNPSLENRVDLAALLKIPFADMLPEAAGDVGEVTKNPQTIILVRKFEALPPPMREAILMQVVATADSLLNSEKASLAKK